MSFVPAVRPSSNTNASTWRKIKYSSRSVTPESCPSNDHRWSAVHVRLLAPHRSGLQRYTPFTVTTSARLEHRLKAVRLHRIATVSGHLCADQSTLAAPVFGTDPDVVAGLEVRLRDINEAHNVIPALAMAARTLSRELGHAALTATAEATG